MSFFGNNRERVGEVLEREGVNGISLSELQTRALPLVDRTQDKEGYKWRSSSGFLSAGETFEEVITQDWMFLENHDLSHSQLATEIKNLIQITRQNRNDQSNNPMTLTYKPTFSLKDKDSLSPQTLIITPVWYISPQFSLFYNPSLPPSAPPSILSSPLPLEENYQWQTEFEIENKDLGLKVTLGGNEKVGLVLYIERYGFFEGGGAANNYRVDPPTLLSILSGIVFEETIDRVKKKKKIEQEEEQKIFENMKSQFSSLSTQEPQQSQQEKEWFEQNIQRQQKKIDDLELGTQTTLKFLKEKILQ